MRLRPGVPLVDVVRSGVVESVHTGHVVVLDGDGAVRMALGDVEQPVFVRSSAKPLQSVAMCALGLDVPPPWLAMATSSHSGEPDHLATVRAMLSAANCSEQDLGCPPDWPLGELARERWLADGDERSRMAMNCSGKHAAMLLTCRVRGWPIGGYLAATHPLQQALAAGIAALTGEPIAATGVDGCGAPVVAVGLTGLATAFSRVAVAGAGPRGRTADAMRAHPHLVAGTGRSATQLMRGVPGLIAKDGAEGVYAAALPDGCAVALKIDDGAGRAADRAVVAALRIAGASGAVLDELAASPVLGGGHPVGQIRVRAETYAASRGARES